MITRKTDPIKVESLFMMFYGAAGVGKTMFAASAKDAIVFDFDGGAKRTVREYDFATFVNFDNMISEIQSGVYDNYQTIVIDTAAKMYQDCISQKLKDLNLWDVAAGQPKLKGGWSKISVLWNELSRVIKDKGKDLIVIAHETKTKAKVGDIDTAAAEIDKRILSIIEKDSDMVGYIYVSNYGERSIDFSLSPSHFAKDSADIGLVKIGNLNPLLGDIQSELPNLMLNIKAKMEAKSNRNVDYELLRLRKLNATVIDEQTANDALKEVLNYKGIQIILDNLKKELFVISKSKGLIYDEKIKQFTTQKLSETDEIEDPTTN